MKRQHEPLRVPDRWHGQDRTLVVQLERMLDEIYRELGKIRELSEALEALTERVAALEEEE